MVLLQIICIYLILKTNVFHVVIGMLLFNGFIEVHKIIILPLTMDKLP